MSQSRDLDRILERLDQLLPPPPPAVDWGASIAFRWRRAMGPNGRGWLQPVKHVHKMKLSDLQGIGPQIAKVDQNTRQFMDGRPANNVLLTGARGTGLERKRRRSMRDKQGRKMSFHLDMC